VRQGEALVEAFAIANGVERSDPLYQIWSEALARIRPPEAGVRPTSAGRPKLTGSGISPPNAPAIETTVQPLQMQGNPRRSAIAAALARGEHPGKNIPWGTHLTRRLEGNGFELPVPRAIRLRFRDFALARLR
jgi:hypothetical protein